MKIVRKPAAQAWSSRSKRSACVRLWNCYKIYLQSAYQQLWQLGYPEPTQFRAPTCQTGNISTTQTWCIWYGIEPATDDAVLHIKWMPTDVYMATRRDLEEKFDDLSEESPYKCNLCDHTFLSRMEFERHQNSVHREQQSIWRLFYRLYHRLCIIRR
jgi:hypothetical protein